MTDAFSEYLILLDDIEQIPLAARESPRRSAEERAAVVARVVELVRDRVLPQSDREEAGLEALLDDGHTGFGDAPQASDVAGHDAILALADELTRANPEDGGRVQELLYRVHAAIAGHFGEAELIHASMGGEEPLVASPSVGVRERSLAETRARVHTGPSTWFG
jgi:hypothetical protein